MSAHPQARRKQWSLLVGTGLVIGWLAFLMVGDLAEAVRFLSTQPSQLWIVAVIALIVGASVWAFDRVPVRVRRQLHLWFLGVTATLLTVAFGWFIHIGMAFAEMLRAHEGATAMSSLLMAPIGLAALGVFVWVAFIRALRKSAQFPASIAFPAGPGSGTPQSAARRPALES